MATQHICPFCGSVMYESGGKANLLGWIVLALLIAILGIGLIAELAKTTDVIKVAGIVASLAFWGGLAYLFIGRKKR